MARILLRSTLSALALTIASPLALTGLGLPPTVLAQSSLTVENLSIESEKIKLTIPRLILEGSTNTEADIRALFDKATLTPWSERFARITARAISIPMAEIRHSESSTQRSVTVYRDVILRDVVRGVIADMITPTTTSRTESGERRAPMSVTTVNGRTQQFDVPHLLRFIFEKGASGEPLKTVIRESSAGSTTFDGGTEGKGVIAGMAVRDFKVRAALLPPAEAFAELERLSKTKTPENNRRAAAIASDLATSFSIESFDANGFAADFKAKDGGAGKMSLAQLSIAGGASVPGRFGLQGLSVEAPDGRVKIGDITVNGLDFTNTFTGLGRFAQGQDGETPSPAGFLPRADLFRVAGVDIDVPDGRNPSERVTAKLGKLEFVMGNHVGAIPANFALVLDQFLLDFPKNTRQSGLRDLIELGYSKLDLSARYDQVWNEQARTLSLKDLTFRSAGMFTSSISAELGNVSRDLFVGDKALAAVAALGVVARSMNVTLTNEGLFEKIIDQQAKQQRKKPEDLRAEIAAMSALGIPMMMAGHPGARALAEAVGKFVAKPGVLQVKATAKGDGLGATDVIGAQNPVEVLKKIDLDSSSR